jgi:hypothetical protein
MPETGGFPDQDPNRKAGNRYARDYLYDEQPHAPPDETGEHAASRARQTGRS